MSNIVYIYQDSKEARLESEIEEILLKADKLAELYNLTLDEAYNMLSLKKMLEKQCNLFKL